MPASTSTALAERVAAEELDLAIISRRKGPFRWKPRRRDGMVALVSGNHPAAKGGVFRTEELGAEPFIEMYPGRESDNSRLLNRLGIRPDVRYTTGDVQFAWAMHTASGSCLTLCVYQISRGTLGIGDEISQIWKISD